MGERAEALLRIVVAIITGIILYVFGFVVQIVTFIHWFYVIFSGKRSKALAEVCNSYCSILYEYARYITFTTNDRPIPFGKHEEVMSVDVRHRRK
ncbi:DUF4389 domain-containing protein [Candidatus Woesearchaeota archaeon]|nr:DUF4389 domain-containing protein [Candidatus Woesearchaeota archaeon]